MGVRQNGTWSARSVGLAVPRQNGKGSVLEARELYALFQGDEELILHSSHLFRTSMDAFRRLRALIENTPDLLRQVAPNGIRTSNGTEGITLKNGKRIQFVARSKGAGRGQTADLVIMDEAYEVTDEIIAALLPTLSARPNPQVWYTSSPSLDVVDGEFFLNLKAQGEAGAEGLLWMDWGAPAGVDLDDKEQWRLSNPGLGFRITHEAIEQERQVMKPESFAREVLGVWPSVAGNFVISPEQWKSLADIYSERPTDVVFSVDVNPERTVSTIVAAGVTSDGKHLVTVVATDRGTDWIPEKVKYLTEKHNPLCWVIDSRGPAASLRDKLDLKLNEDIEKVKRGELILMTATDVIQAWGKFIDSVLQGQLVHLNEAPLNIAVQQAKTRPVLDGTAWSRKNSTDDITPLVAATNAAWALSFADQIKTVIETHGYWF